MRATVAHGLLLLLAFVAVAAPTPAAYAKPAPHDAAPATPAAHLAMNERRLGNGLTVIVQEDHRTPLVSVTLRYDVGERAAPDGLHGIATLTQKLASNATGHVAVGDAARLLHRAGSSLSETTATDFTVLSATLPAYRLALPLWIWSDQMGFFDGAVDEARFRAERDELAEQMRGARERSPLANAERFAAEELFPPGHAYHEDAGTPESVARIERAQVLAFHDRWMTPDHATLVIVGDVTEHDAFSEVERYFGPIPASAERPAVPLPPLPKLTGETRLDVRAQVPTARVSIRWPTPGFTTAEDAHLDILAKILGGQHRAYLYWELVTNQKLASSVTIRQRSRNLGAELEVFIEGVPGKSAEELVTGFDVAMRTLEARPIDPDEIAHAAYELLVDRIYALEADDVRSREYARLNVLNGSAASLPKDFERYARITPEMVSGAWSHFLPLDRRVVLLITPALGAPPGGERRGRRTIPARQP